jgi:5'-phosphate synthase pdxT subunit
MWEVLEKGLDLEISSGRQPLRIFGTCAGAILCQYLGGNFVVDRNGYGSQQDSFIDTLDSSLLPEFQGVFIRAPRFSKLKKEVEILATYKKEPVLLQDRNFLVASFHPEMTEDDRLHHYFLSL